MSHGEFADDLFELTVAIEYLEAMAVAMEDIATTVDGQQSPNMRRLVALTLQVERQAIDTADKARTLQAKHGLCACGSPGKIKKPVGASHKKAVQP